MKNIKEKISVVISAYNGEKYIVEQLQSILTQSIQPDEIIICDDCSSDMTIAKAEECLKGSNINYRVIHHINNAGVLKSFTELLKQSTGDIVFLCDQDDVWLPDKIKKFVDCFHHDHSDLVFSDALITDGQLRKTGTTLWQENNIFFLRQKMRTEQIISEMIKRNLFTGMSMAVTRKLIHETDFNVEYMLHDELLGWTALRYGKVSFLPECTAYYRQHGNNTIGVTKKYTKFKNMKQATKKVKESTTLSYMRITTVSNFFDGSKYQEQIAKTIHFYQERLQLYSESKIKAIFDYIKLVPQYGIYSIPTAHEKQKDLAVILFHH